MSRHICSQTHVLTLLLTNKCSDTFAHKHMFRHICSQTHAQTHMLTNTCSDTFAHKHMLRPICLQTHVQTHMLTECHSPDNQYKTGTLLPSAAGGKYTPNFIVHFNSELKHNANPTQKKYRPVVFHSTQHLLIRVETFCCFISSISYLCLDLL